MTVIFSGWLASYFPATEMRFKTETELDTALPELMNKVMDQAIKPVPQGGLLVTINGKNLNELPPGSMVLKDDDEINFIPVVAGG